MKPLDVLRPATRLNKLGNIKPGYLADLVAVSGNPADDIKAVKQLVINLNYNNSEVNM